MTGCRSEVEKLLPPTFSTPLDKVRQLCHRQALWNRLTAAAPCRLTRYLRGSMMASVILIVLLTALSASDAVAQEGSIPLEVDAARAPVIEQQRIPAMIVQDAGIPKPEEAKKDPVAPKPIM